MAFRPFSDAQTMFQPTSLSLLIFLTAVLNALTMALSWRRQKTRYGRYFSLGIVGTTFWTLAESLDYAAVRLPDKIFFAKLELLGYNAAA